MKIHRLETMVEFLNSLNSLQTYDSELFSLQALEYFDRYLGFGHSAMVVIDNGYVVSDYGHNISRDMEDVSDNKYIASYITENWDKIKKEGKVLCSTEIFPQDNEYIDFIEDRIGMHYALILPFKEVYMALYHTEEEGDFTEPEKSLLNAVYQFLKGSDALRHKARNERYVSNFRDSALDEMKVGFLVFDSNFNLIHNNRYAMQAISGIFGTIVKNKLFEKLCAAFNLNDEVMKSDCQAVCKGYTMKVSHFYKEEVYGVTRHFVNVTIKKELIEKNTAASTVSSIAELTKREEEIIKCLSAGMQYQEAADYLMISINTFRTHIKNIYKKTGVNSQHELLKQYYSD